MTQLPAFGNQEVKTFEPMAVGKHNLTIESYEQKEKYIKVILVNGKDKVFANAFDIADIYYTFDLKEGDNIIGVSKEFDVTHEEYNGKTYANIKFKTAPIKAGDYRARVEENWSIEEYNGRVYAKLKMKLSPIGDQTPPSLQGKICGIKIKHDTYNGKTYAKASVFFDPSSLPVWSDGQAKATTTQQPTNDETDEIPF